MSSTAKRRAGKLYKARIQKTGQLVRTDLTPAREQIQSWIDAGFSTIVIAKALNILHDSSIAMIRSGAWHSMDREIVAKIMELRPHDLYQAAEYKDWVPAIAATRRMRAAQVIGHRWEEMCDAKQTAMRILSGRSRLVQADTHHQVAAAYRKLICKPGDSDRVRSKAKAKGWPGPLHWSDVSIVDPYAEPDTDIVAHQENFVDRVEDALYVGMSGEKIATMLGVRPSSLQNRLREHDRYDLARKVHR